MVYLNKFVVAVKVNGKILRENQNTVLIPFGTEYSILLKNLDSRRALARLSIDGDSVDNTGFIVAANGSVEIERYIRNGNMNSGNRFKFIERGKEVEKHRGIKADDGIIRVEFTAERIVKEETVIRRHYIDEYPWCPPQPPYPPPRWPRPWRYRSTPWCSASAQRSCSSGTQAGRGITNTVGSINMAASLSSPACSTQSNDTGITVAGSQSNQQFVYGAWFPTESHSDVIVLHLRGAVGEQYIERPITVDHKPQCSTCGNVNKGGSQFCSQCGTALVIV